MDATKHSIMRWLADLQAGGLSDHTKATYKYMIRRFYRWLGKPEVVNWMPMSVRKKYRDAAELLTKDEVERLARHTPYFRDRVYINTLWESGCRWGEINGLQVKHITFDENGAILSINGKTGRRLVRIVESARYLKEYITDMEGGEQVFKMSRAATRAMLRRAASRTGIRKRVNPHSFRFSRATYLASRGLNTWQMMKHFGWSNPQVAQTYIRMSIGDLDKAILSLYEG